RAGGVDRRPVQEPGPARHGPSARARRRARQGARGLPGDPEGVARRVRALDPRDQDSGRRCGVPLGGGAVTIPGAPVPHPWNQRLIRYVMLTFIQGGAERRKAAPVAPELAFWPSWRSSSAASPTGPFTPPPPPPSSSCPPPPPPA